jgi:hypothetical protein
MHLELNYSELSQLNSAIDGRLSDFYEAIDDEVANPTDKNLLDWMHDQVNTMRDLQELLHTLCEEALREEELTRV